MHNMFDHQKTIKRRKHQTCKHGPAWRTCHVSCFCSTLKAALMNRKKFLAVRNGFTVAEVKFPRFTRTTGAAGHRKKRLINRMANCFTLLRRTTALKVSIQKSSQSTFTLRKVASIGPMAPCRSHHRNRTRQEWIFNRSLGK